MGTKDKVIVMLMLGHGGDMRATVVTSRRKPVPKPTSARMSRRGGRPEHS
jgi:hypothetical protein